MFVAINNTEKNIFEVDKWIKTTRDADGGVISPEFAMEILGKTNFLGHIKKVLKNIKDNCTTTEELMPYKEFILSCVDEREMSEDALRMLQEMATLCGCEDEFNEANNKIKFYSKYDCDNITTVKSKEEFAALKGEDLTVYFNADMVDLYACDLSNVKEIKFKEGARVCLASALPLPKGLDFSKCSAVDLRDCDLEGLNLEFREDAEVYLKGAKNLPEVLDLSLSLFSWVDLSFCDFKGVKEIKFREGAEVNLNGAKNLPEVLDLSMCSKVDLTNYELSGVKQIKFKDKKQEKEVMRRVECFECKFVYADEDNSLFSRMKKRFDSGGMGE